MNCRNFAVLLLLLACSGCIKVDTGPRSPTLGEQVVELTRAKELGALTEEEFRELRRKVLANL